MSGRGKGGKCAAKGKSYEKGRNSGKSVGLKLDQNAPQISTVLEFLRRFQSHLLWFVWFAYGLLRLAAKTSCKSLPMIDMEKYEYMNLNHIN